jgi:hypothetical protein
LEQFAQRRQPDWNIPRIQIIFDFVSAVVFFMSVAVILFSAFHHPTLTTPSSRP